MTTEEEKMINQLCNEVRWMRHGQLWHDPTFHLDKGEYERVYELALQLQSHMMKRTI